MSPTLVRKVSAALRALPLRNDLHGEERRVLDLDADPLNRRHKDVTAVRVAPQDGGKEPHQRLAPDRAAAIVPGPVGGDAHVDFAAIRRIPALHGARLRLFARLRDKRGETRRQPGRPGRHVFCCLHASASGINSEFGFPSARWVTQSPGQGISP